MADQLLATFYVQSPEFLYGNTAVTAQVQYQSNNYWYQNTSELTAAVTPAHYNDPANDNQLRYRYKIDVFRAETSEYDYNTGSYRYYYPLYKAGTYNRRLRVTFNNSFTLDRMIYLTIQPNIQAYRDVNGTRIDLVRTDETVISQNPLQKQLTVNVISTPEALAARNINLTEPNDYKGIVFTETNLPVDLVSNDLSIEENVNNEYDYDVWLRLQNQIRITRKIGSSEYRWNDGYGSFPIIKTDLRGNYARFITDNNESGYETPLLRPDYGTVGLGLEKPFLDLPLAVNSSLQLAWNQTARYTGIGETTENTAPVNLPLQAVIKTLHAVKIVPAIITLGEDNNYTSFIAVEANDGADWSFAPVDSRITVSPSSGTGRAAVVVKKAALHTLAGFLESVPLAVTSTVNAVTYPDIDGNYIASDTAAVHLEKYTPLHNALIPRMESGTAEGFSITHIPNDSANELMGNYAAFAITSEDDILTIDAGEAVVLDKIEIRGQNIRRLITSSAYKGGAAVAFSLLATNDPNGQPIEVNSGDEIDTRKLVFSGITGSQDSCYYLYEGNMSYYASSSLPFAGYTIPQEIRFVDYNYNRPDLRFTAIYDALAQTFTLEPIQPEVLEWAEPYRIYTDWGENITANITGNAPLEVDGAWIILRNGSAGKIHFAANNNSAYDIGGWTYDDDTFFTLTGIGVTAYQYYKIVPVNRSLDGREISCTLFSLKLYKKTSASPLTIPVNITSAPVSVLPLSVYQAFDHSLSVYGFAGRFTTGMYAAGGTLASTTGNLNPASLDNLEKYPAVEVTFDAPHRVRSWTLQSAGRGAGDAVFESHATVLVLQGRTLDGAWKILDLARTPNETIYDDYNYTSRLHALYTDDKIRVDRAVQHAEIVDTIRISAVAVKWAENGGLSNGGLVWFPQIQVFAGVPLLPRMTSNNNNGVTIRANSSDNGVKVFDKEVSGTNVAAAGNRAWYINNNHFLLEDVAENGNISQFGSYQSKGWLSLMFPRTRILGYLYTIDNLLGRTDSHANTSYAASLYFEGRANADDNATLEPSQGYWDFIDLVSLDHCIGHNEFGVPTAALIAEVNQTTLNTYAGTLGLPVVDKTFLMNRTDRHIIRYDAGSGEWYDDGFRLEPGTAALNQFNNMTTSELLAEPGQSRLNSVALVRGQSMQPPYQIIPDKAAIVNQYDAKRVMYDLATAAWSEVPNNDAIYNVHNRTHYADLKDSNGQPLLLAQLRCTIQSIMNTEKPSVPGEPVAMPEMQFFGLPADTINAGAAATITYLKAEDAAGKLHDVLGRHITLPCRQATQSYYGGWTSSFRFYIGTVQNIKSNDKKLYLSIQNTNGQMTTVNVLIDNVYTSLPYREISVSGNYAASPAYFELYIFSANDEKIVLASGYT